MSESVQAEKQAARRTGIGTFTVSADGVCADDRYYTHSFSLYLSSDLNADVPSLDAMVPVTPRASSSHIAGT